MDQRPIGIFDSGVGGLTVARSIIDLLPYESVVYFADTARYPYGPRQQAEVRGFAKEIMDVLLAEDVKLAVVACNTASAAALHELRAAYPVPVVDVIEPTAQAAVRLVRSAAWTARQVFAELTRADLHAPFGADPQHRFLVSGDPEQFRRLGARFLGPEVGTVERRSTAAPVRAGTP